MGKNASLVKRVKGSASSQESLEVSKSMLIKSLRLKA